MNYSKIPSQDIKKYLFIHDKYQFIVKITNSIGYTIS